MKKNTYTINKQEDKKWTKCTKNTTKNQNLTKQNNNDILSLFPKGGIKIYEKRRKSIIIYYEDNSH